MASTNESANTPPLADRLQRLAPLAVLLAAVLAAAGAYLHFLGVADRLFPGICDHDRNAHYWLGLSIGSDLRSGSVGRLLDDLHRARTWPPLHAVLVGIVLAVGGIDFRLAVLPSLAGWVGAAFFAFLLARRAVPRGGTLAGVLAAAQVLTSPALKAYATDIMLESLGACFSLMVLYFYVRAVQEPSARASTCLAVGFTVLFFHKYNYWMLIVAALAATELTSRPRFYWNVLQSSLEGWREWGHRQLRQPLNYLLAILLALPAVLHCTGPLTIHLGGQDVSLKAAGLLLELPYVAFFLRLAQWWWQQGGRQWCAAQGDAVRPLIYWGIWPIALWFLWPQRLSYFLWYVAAPHGAQADSSFAGGLVYYWNCLAGDYHCAAASALLVAVLGMGAVWGRRWLKPGGQAVLWFIVLAVLLTARHPNQKSRCMHSWVAGAWVAAGMGAAYLAYGSSRERRFRPGPWLAASAVAGLAVLQYPGWVHPGHAQEGGPQQPPGTQLVVTDWFLPHLAGARECAVIATTPMKFLTWWTALERYGPRPRIVADVPGLDGDAEQRRGQLTHWLATTNVDPLVYVDVAPHSPRYVPNSGCARNEMLRQALPCQSRYIMTAQHDFPESGCRVSVWRLAPASPAAAAP